MADSLVAVMEGEGSIGLVVAGELADIFVGMESLHFDRYYV